MNNANRPAPPSSEYEVFHSSELTGKILPEGSMYHDGYSGRWGRSIYIGSSPVPWSWYAIPAWRMIDKCDDVLPEGWQYRMRGESEWCNGSRIAIGKRPANLQQCEYRAPTLPREAKAPQTVKRTLWVPASERQPPFGVPVHWRRVGVRCMDLGPADTRNEHSVWDNDIEWLDLDAAEAIEAERDKLAKENEKLRADNEFLNAAIDAAVADREHFEAEADRLRARIAEIEREVAPRKADCATNPVCVAGSCIGCIYLDAGEGHGFTGSCTRFPTHNAIHDTRTWTCGEFKKKPEISISEYYDTSQDAQR